MIISELKDTMDMALETELVKKDRVDFTKLPSKLSIPMPQSLPPLQLPISRYNLTSSTPARYTYQLLSISDTAIPHNIRILR